MANPASHAADDPATISQVSASGQLPDVIAKDLGVLFCGLNPGLQAAATGHHFVGRGNRFWRVLHEAGFTATQLRPKQDRELLDYGCGLTVAVCRPTARASELSQDEFAASVAGLFGKLRRFSPRRLAFLGKAAYASLTSARSVEWGRQARDLEGVEVWVLPNPSGLNRGFSLEDLVQAYRPLRRAMDASAPVGSKRR
jgi:TDG/mug DNA glycosylase family protein